MIFINEKEYEDIYNMLEVSIKNKYIEFELLYGTKRVDKKIISTITKENFVNLSTYLIQRSSLPNLPEDLKTKLGYYFNYEEK